MPFVGISSEYSMSGYTILENVFISEYMPYSPDHCNKVYLYGLYLAHSGASANDIESMSRALSLDVPVIQDVYAFWQGCGIVQIISKNPFEVRYLSVKRNLSGKKYSQTKYASFNQSLSTIITGRQILPFEWHQYYDTMETYHIEPSAMIMIAKYCATIKDANVGYPYILTVARNWASQDITTVRAVEERLKLFEQTDTELGDLLKAMSIRRKADVEERQLYRKFLDMGFSKDALIYVAKKCKKGGFSKLDRLLTEYFSARLTDVKEIEAHEKNRDALNALCRTVNKLIGVWYDQIDHEIDTYIIPWTSMGFDAEAITLIADHCFKTNVRTLEGMNQTVNKMFKEGLISAESIAQFLGQMNDVDKSIRQVLERAGLKRAVNSWDRDSYRTWTYTWQLSHELVLRAAELANGKAQPIPYMNRILSEWRNKGVTIETVETHISSAQTQATEKSASNYVKDIADDKWASVVSLKDLEV